MTTAERAQLRATPPLPEDHHCPWRDEVLRLRCEIEALRGELAALKRQVFGQKSEKMPSVDHELHHDGSLITDPKDGKQKRKTNADLMKKLVAVVYNHFVPKERQVCPHCADTNFKPLGPGKTTVIFELIPAVLQRRVHVQQTLVCSCGKTIVIAPGPIRVFKKGRYGPRFIAHLIVTKCADAIGLNRLAERWRRQGVPMSRNTLVDQFQRAGELLRSLADLLLTEIATSDVAQGDSTTMRVQNKGKTRRAYLLTFLDPLKKLIGYRFSLRRNGQTACKVLGKSQGVFVADAGTEFNEACEPGGRRRGGCMSHARRKFFDALSFAAEARQPLDFILELYRVERAAKDAGIQGSPEHLQLRQTRSQPVMENFRAWLTTQQTLHQPKSPMRKAINYALNNWDALGLFLTDARIPLDNNASEQVLRIVAQGRKNFLFVGNEEAGHNIAALYSLVMTAIAQGLNAEDYLADVLIRIKGMPNSRLHELLPQNWTPPTTQSEPQDST